MPVISVEIGTLPNRVKKQDLVQALTAAASSSTGIPAEKFIVLINELDRDNIGVGGKLLSDLSS